MRKALIGMLAAGAIAAVGIPARAQQPAQAGPSAGPGEDVLYLKDGGMLRGTILEIIPNDHVTLQLANGQTATVQWSYLTRVEQRGAAPPGAAPPAAAPAAPKRTVVVHLEADRPVRLEAIEGKKQFKFICSNPCDITVDADGRYRITGDGVRPTGEFSISGTAQRVVIDVDTSSKGGFVWGIVLVSVSPIVALIGLVVYAVSAVEVTNSPNGRAVGTAMGLGGLGGIALGIVLIVSNSRSKATQTEATPQAPPPPRPAALAETPYGDPWRLAVPASGVVSVPILHF